MKRNNNALSLNQYQNYFNPITPDIYFQNGVVKMEMNEFYDALINFTRAIELDQNFALAYYNRGYRFKISQILWMKQLKILKKPCNLNQIIPYIYQISVEARKYTNKAQQLINYLIGCLQKISYGFGQVDIQQVEKSIELLVNNRNGAQLNQQQKITKNEEYQYIQKNDLESLNKNGYVAIEHFQKGVYQLEQKQQSQEILNQQHHQQFQQINQRLDKIENFEVIFLEKKLKELYQPQNVNKLLYYQSFCQHILVFFQVCQLMEQNYFKVNRDKGSNFLTKFLDYISGVSQATLTSISVFLEPIKQFIAQGIIIALQIFDQSIESYEQGVITEKLLKILNVFRSRFGTFSEAEKEIQMAVFQKVEEITEEDLDISSFEYSDETIQVITNQAKHFQKAKNKYWQLGVFHYLIVLKYLEKESNQLASQNLRLRDIIFDGMRTRASKNKNNKSEKNKVELDPWWKCY